MEKRPIHALSVDWNRNLVSLSESMKTNAVLTQEFVNSIQTAFSPMKELNEQIHKSFSHSILLSIPPLLPQVLQPILPPNIAPTVKLFEALPSTRMLTETILNLDEMFAPIREQSAGFLDYANFLQEALAKQAARDAKVLDDSGFFFRDILSKDDLFKLFAIEQVNPRVRNAALTNTLLRVTRKGEFAKDLETSFKNSSVLQGRWPIIERALDAHQHRIYLLSVPAFFAQVEGMLVDALVMKEILYVENNEVYLRSDDPQNPKGRKLQGISNVADQVKKSDLQEDRSFRIFADYVSDTLAPERNHVMHGREIDYGKAMLSVKLLLYIWRMATEISDQEGTIGSTLTSASKNAN